MKIDLLDPVVSATPGETATCRVRVLNDTAGPSAYRLRVVGLDDHEFEYPLGLDALPSGMEASFDVGIVVPREFSVGRHALAVEVMSDRRGELPVLTGMTVEVASIQHVSMRINPSTIRGRRKARFAVEIDNREPRPVDLDLGAQGQGLEVAFRRKKLHLNPGDVVSVPGTVRGPRRVARGPVNHVLTVVAESKSAPIFTDAAFQQRPFLPSRFRSGMAMLALVGLWVGILGGGVYWYTHRDNGKVTQTLTTAVQDANGDGVPDDPIGTGAAAGGAAAGGAAGGAAAAAAAAAANAAKQSKPTSTVIGGTVKAGETGDDSGVTVSLTPAVLGGVAPTSAQAAALQRGGSLGANTTSDSKIWPARYGRDTTSGVSSERRTESVVTQQTDGKGAWAFTDVLIPDNYTLTFTKPGFDTKSFIVTPTEDGKAVALDVVLATASGSASGVINGPDGPIGGVDIVISDGDLTFTTKSSSEAGKVGTWSVTGLSTPNTYTLTAALRGFGTQVVQLPLTPGQQRGGVGIAMIAGVGSISGHVTGGTTPLGGATITVSSGDLTRSTTSLTDGDAGSYLVPQLTIPGTYTVAVTAAGYMTQTRQLDLSGNAVAIDFNLVHTTASIVGVVASDTNGNLGGVGITIRHDDLVFTSATAAAPSAGTFRINDVPPGEYLVSFSRYDHVDTSQLITVAGGEVRDLGTITMKFQARSALAQTGRLIVPIFDSGSTAINGATVQVLSASDGSVIRTATDAAGTQGSFAFENMPIGTYTVRVTRPGFRTAVRHVTMGLSEKQLEVHMLQLGQVSGVLVNSLNTTQQLKNYEIKIYRLNPDGSRNGAELERITVLSSQAPDADGNILWESQPSSLTEGLYEVEVSQPPTGFHVVPQVVQDGAPLMRFVVSPTDEGTLRLKDIKVDSFPSLTGTVSAPKLIGGSITFTPIKTANVALRCGAGPVLTSTVSNSVAAPGTYTFSFDGAAIQAATSVTSMCSVTVTATIPPVAPATAPTIDPAYNPVTVSLASALDPIAGGLANQQINVALAKIPASIGGKLYWRDAGDTNPATRDHPINSVSINTEGTVITDFGGSTGTPPAITTTTPIIGTNSAGGDWALVGQVFGDATYVFNNGQADPAFEVGKLMLTINESTRTVVSLTTSTLSAVDNSPSIDVELQPVAGAITGTTSINSVNAPSLADYNSIGISTLAPVGVTAPAPTRPGGGSAYSIAAAAGTWKVTFTPPPHYVFAGNSKATSPTNQTITSFVGPNTTVSGVSVQLTKLAQLSIDVVDGSASVTPFGGGTPTVTFTRVPNPVIGDPGASVLASQQPSFNPAGHALIQDLDVNTANPTTAAANYRVSVSMPGYDTEFADVVLSGTAAGTAIPSTPGATTNTNLIPVPLLAGQTAALRVVLKPFGGITANAIGVLPASLGGGTELLFASAPAPSLGQVTAVRMYYPDGITAVTPAASPSPVTYDVDKKTFSFSGAPGYYQITVTHPDFAAASSVPAPTIGGPAGMYLLANDASLVLAAPFSLPLATGFVHVNAQGSGGAALPGATIYVNARGDTSGLGTVGTGTTDPLGGFTLGNLPAGMSYTVVMRALSGTPRFPVIVDVTVPRGSSDAARTVTVTAKLVEVDSQINGSIAAKNSRGHAVTLPAGPVAVSRTYDGNGAGVTNQAHDSDTVSITDPSTDATFQFLNVARGTHNLVFPVAAGYSKPADRTVSVISSAAASGGVNTYTAADVTVVVTLSVDPLLFPGATPVADAIVKLIAPDLTVYNVDASPVHTGTSYRFSAIPPETADYTLSIEHPLYDVTPGVAMTSAVNIAVGAAPQNIAAALTPLRAQIRGHVVLQSTSSTTAATGSSTIVTLLKSGVLVPGTNVVPNTVNLDATGNFVFSLNSLATYPDTYTVAVQSPGYTPAQMDVTVDNLGTAVGLTDLTANKQARLTVAVTPNTIPFPAGPTPPTLTASAVPTAGTTVSGACAKSAAATPVITCTFNGLDSGVAYAMTFSAPGYNDGSLSLTPVIGGNTTDTVNLAQPNVKVSVTTDLDGNDAKTATVTLLIAGEVTARTPNHDVGSPDYTFVNLPVGASGTITVSKAGYRTQTSPLTVSGGGSTVSIALRQLVTVTGLVVANGTAAGGATVHATPVGGGTMVTATANGGGSYTLTGLDVGNWVLSGYKVAATGGGADVGETLQITSTSQSSVTPGLLTLLARQVAITGKVTGGTPNSGGATVVAKEMTTGALYSATVDTNNDYSVAVDVGTWQITAYLAGAGAAVSATTVGLITDLNPAAYAGTLPGPNLALVPRNNVTISGTIRNGAGSTVTGATVVATNTSTGLSEAAFTTPAGGTYSFAGLDVGNWVISASKNAVGYAISSGIQVTALSPNVVSGTNLTLVPRSVSAGGSVAVLASGATAPFATVNAKTSDGQSATTTALASGDYSLTLPNLGTWTISGYLNGVGAATLAATQTVTGTSPMVLTNLDLDLVPRAVTVSGTVKKSGTAVNGAIVTAISADNATLTTTSNSSGVYSFSGGNALNVGSWTLTASANNVGVAIAGTAIVVNDISPAAVTSFDFALVNRSVTISGKVTGSTITGAQVVAQNTVTGAVTTAVTVNSSGNYSISGVNVGTWEISAYLDGVGAGISGTNVTITAGSPGSVGGINIALAPRSVIATGTVTAGGVGVGGAAVVATRSGIPTPAVTTAVDGTYSISIPNVGSWTITATLNGTGAGTSPSNVVVTSVTNDPDPGHDVALTARAFAYNFTGLLTAASTSITMGGVTNSATASSLTLNVPETATRTWTATQAGAYTATGSVALGSASAPTAVPVGMVAIPTITGTITANGAALTTARVLLCPGTPPSANCVVGNGAVLADVSGSTGSFSIPPVNSLTVGGSYYLTVAEPGYNSSNQTVTLAANGTFSTTPIVLTVRTFDYLFSTGVSGASVTMGGVNGLTTGGGQVTLSVPQLQPLTWTATKAGYYPASGTATIGTASTTTAVSAPLVAIPPISGTVQLTAGGAAHSAASVLLCPSALADASCVVGNGGVIATTSADGTGAFTFGVVNSLTVSSSYYVKAIDAALTGSANVGTDSAGALTGTPIVVGIA